MKNNIPTEHQEQCTVIQYCTVKKLLVFAIPNGAYLNGTKLQRAKQMNRLKAEGLKIGVPDLFLPMPRGQYHGLFIEMKRQKGSATSAEQKAWAITLSSEGYKAVICKGAEEAIREIDRYLKGD